MRPQPSHQTAGVTWGSTHNPPTSSSPARAEDDAMAAAPDRIDAKPVPLRAAAVPPCGNVGWGSRVDSLACFNRLSVDRVVVASCWCRLVGRYETTVAIGLFRPFRTRFLINSVDGMVWSCLVLACSSGQPPRGGAKDRRSQAAASSSLINSTRRPASGAGPCRVLHAILNAADPISHPTATLLTPYPYRQPPHYQLLRTGRTALVFHPSRSSFRSPALPCRRLSHK